MPIAQLRHWLAVIAVHPVCDGILMKKSCSKIVLSSEPGKMQFCSIIKNTILNSVLAY